MTKLFFKLTSSVAVLLSSATDVFAQPAVVNLPSADPGSLNLLFFLKFARTKTFVGNLISAFLPAVLGIAGFITVIFIVISGIQFITSSGNPEAAAGAKNRLIYALVGFALIVLAFAITQIIDKIFLGGTGVV